jgi:hypothetical protein
MTSADQSQAFMDAVNDVVERFKDEFDLTYVDMIGVMEMVKTELLVEAGELMTAEEVKDAIEEATLEDEEDENESDIPGA